MALKVGQQLGDYEVVGVLGAGGMGEVYRARDSALGREVALKILPEAFTNDEGRLRRLEREARLLATLNHPGIATIHGLEKLDGLPVLVLELVDGPTLDVRLTRGPLPLREALALASQVAEALAAAHEKDIVHRDVKPSNIKLTSEGRVKLLDFGLAKALGADGSDCDSRSPTVTGTEAGAILGTPAYMSPEQARGEALDKRTDVWSFGCVLYEMLTGKRAFGGVTSSDSIAAILEREPDWTALPQGAPTEIQSLLRRCLQKDRTHRLRDIGDARIEIEEVLATRSGQPQPALAGSKASTGRHGVAARRWSTLAAAVAVVLSAVVGIDGWCARQRSPAPGPIRSIAVLPLENLSGDPEQEYFADGMTDVLIGDLSRIGALRVISRTSSMHYKGARKPLSEIARELKVDAVVEGSVFRSGERVRVSASLFSAASEQSLWTESYERDLREILILQRELAQAMAREIRIKLTPQDEERLAGVRPVDPALYQLYLQGRFHLQKGTEEALRKSIDAFREIVQRDAGYAPAYAGLATCYKNLGSVIVGQPPRDTTPLAIAAAAKALALDDGLAEAHTAFAAAKLFEWEWSAAERGFKRALELDPSRADAHIGYSRYLMIQGSMDQAIAEAKLGLQLDPLSADSEASAGFALHHARRHEDAIPHFRSALQLSPTSLFATQFLGICYTETGRSSEAIAILEAALKGFPDNTAFLGTLIRAQALTGRGAAARRLFAGLTRAAKERYVPPATMALVNVWLGDHDAAFDWLERAYAERSDFMIYMGTEPWLDPIRSDPRFRDLLRRVGLPERADALPAGAAR